MNIVKGVAGLLRRTSLGQAGENPVGSQAEGFLAPPWPEIKFGSYFFIDVLKGRHLTAIEQEEKKKALDAFLLHFQQVYEDWRPAEWQNQLSSQTNAALVASLTPASQSSSYGREIVIGCSAGHPTRVILALTQELKSIIDFLTELQSIPDLTDAAPNPARMEGGLRFLDALRILTRSIHNQRVFSYYGGLQSLMALMKVAVLQLKALTGAVAMDESQPYSVSVQMSFLQCLLAQIVSVVSNFIGANSCHDEKDIISCYDLGQAVLKNEAGLAGADMFSGSGSSGFSSRKNSSLKQGATIPLMETGGLNWFVELLRVLRRLRLKNQVTEMSLEQLTLRTLKAALTANPRAQNHFKSIGGLEVLIDALGITSKNTIGNLVTMSRGNDPRILCSFLVPAGDIQTLSSELFDGQGAIGVSASYWELAVKWILKVLLSVFPLKKACCDQDEMLSGERILSSTLQHFLLCVFQKILSVTPTVLPTFREEGVWDLMFSEYFFYFKVGVEGNSSPILLDPEAVEKASSAHILMSEQSTCPSPYKNENSNLLENEIFQMEVISFVEFAATINGRSDNWLPPLTEKDQEAKLGLCFKYLETFPRAKESDWQAGTNISANLLAGVRDILQTDLSYYQALFREGECFLHIVTLLNGNFIDGVGEQLSLDVVRTLIDLLTGNEASKVAFRALVGSGYQTLQSLLLDCFQGLPSWNLLNVLLDMLVDGNFNILSNMVIQNEDVITLFFNILKQCNETLQCYGLEMFHHLLEESTANRASCVRAGLLSRRKVIY